MYRSCVQVCVTASVALFVLMCGLGLAYADPEGTKTPIMIGAWVSLVLLAPGVLGLWVAAAREAGQAARARANHKEADAAATPSGEVESTAAASRAPGENRFFVAALAATIWAVALSILAWVVPVPGGKVYFIDPELTFPLYVPIFGFLGALLYVLDLSRRGREDIPKGTEFGMRLIMGPYVAIVMVSLFGQNLGIAQIKSDLGKAALAFFSGLLVTLAFQGMIEKGQEVLGRWREKARYTPSDIAKRFDLTRKEDQMLRKAGLKRLVQLQERSERTLREEVKKVGFDEHLAVGFKREVARDFLAKKIGARAREQFAKIADAKSIEDIAHLNDRTLDKVARTDRQLAKQDLVALRDEAKTLVASVKLA